MLATGLILYAVLAAQSGDSLPPAAARVLTDVRYLAADEREGRGAGTNGLEAASRYIAAVFVSELVWALAHRAGPLTFVDAPPPVASTGGPGYGAYLGTIPDMSESPGGVRLTGVRAGSPAQRAALQAGDVITAIGAKIVANLYDMTDALRSHQPGDTVTITARRGATDVRVTAVLGKRSS